MATSEQQGPDHNVTTAPKIPLDYVLEMCAADSSTDNLAVEEVARLMENPSINTAHVPSASDTTSWGLIPITYDEPEARPKTPTYRGMDIWDSQTALILRSAEVEDRDIFTVPDEWILVDNALTDKAVAAMETDELVNLYFKEMGYLSEDIPRSDPIKTTWLDTLMDQTTDEEFMGEYIRPLSDFISATSEEPSATKTKELNNDC